MSENEARAAHERGDAECPRCRGKGRRISATTLRGLLTEEAHAVAEAAGAEALRFCKAASCPVVYFGDGLDVVFEASDLRVPVFQKSGDPARPVCYCFGVSVARLEEEVARTGGSSVPEEITQKCREGLDRCEETNPQGACCLGNVRRVVKEAGALAPAPAVDCCAVTPETVEPPVRAGRAGLWSVGGALAAAVLSSACCWLPLLLIGLGGTSVGAAAFFEASRWWFVGASALLLGAGFYFVYFRAPRCAPGDACARPDPRLRRWSRASPWVATVLVLAFATFPGYVGALLGTSSGEAVAAPSGGGAATTTATLAIAGMTCRGCAIGLETGLRDHPGVASATVDFEAKRAVVTYDPAKLTADALLEAIAELGFRATPQGGS